MFTGQERQLIVSKLNEHIDLPHIPDGMEEAVISKAVDLIESAMGAVIPSQLQALLHVESGIEPGEHLEIMAERLATYINGRVNLPYLSEETEHQLISALCHLASASLAEAMDVTKVANQVGSAPAKKPKPTKKKPDRGLQTTKRPRPTPQ